MPPHRATCLLARVGAGVATVLLLASCGGVGEPTNSATSGSEWPAATTTTDPPTPVDPRGPASPSARPGSTSPPGGADTPAAREFGVAFPGVDWTRPDGSPAGTRHGINLIAGSDHCDWGLASLLHIPWPLDVQVADSSDLRQYVWDPAGQLEDLGVTEDRLVTDVPGDATATGFRTAHQHLWLGDDADDVAYLVADTGEVRRLARPLVLPGGILACD